ncbi:MULTISPECIES: DUF6377 domain-containing protein [Sphingobacterium]|uniref:DUF6377 domain-containing protein n=1 Tax=Sphingobacterium populi TaxID=1812824 RepID=A0ABW5U9S0_9SPHI|nr:DUF6377 domain-containing protein [Sphingobacterium sp. CFCC 11742]
MKRILLTKTLILLFFLPFFVRAKDPTIDSLLRVLDQSIKERNVYTKRKEGQIDSLKILISKTLPALERIRLQDNLISAYQSFKCDSALVYIQKNIELATSINNQHSLLESKLKSAFVLAMSGLFTQSRDILDSITYSSLPTHLKIFYCWSIIRYNENLIKYTANEEYTKFCKEENYRYRDTLIHLLGEGSDMYKKEKSFQLLAKGAFAEAAEIQSQLFANEKPNTHGYAMSAMGLSIVYEELGNNRLKEYYLLLAAITDVKLAVKENEALLKLAIYLQEHGDTDRAYTYINAALEDANFFNSRFRNAVIARSQPLIQATYLHKIAQQSKNLRQFALGLSVLVLGLILTLYFLYKQIIKVSEARKHLKIVNEQLRLVNIHLDEANLIRERYLGHYINQCGVYLDKLDEFRKSVQRKIKAGQIEDLQRINISSRAQQRDAEELYASFDKTFFQMYPNFLKEFNTMLREGEQYDLEKNQLNTELRIFALMRLGISDVNQIALFLKYSIQTIYNYKSKVKNKALPKIEHFEDKVKQIGVFNRANI